MGGTETRRKAKRIWPRMNAKNAHRRFAQTSGDAPEHWQLATRNWPKKQSAVSTQHSAFSQTGDLITKEHKEELDVEARRKTRGFTAKDAEGEGRREMAAN